MVFDETSPWWSTQLVILTDSKDIEDMVEEKMGEQKDRVKEEPQGLVEVERRQ